MAGSNQHTRRGAKENRIGARYKVSDFLDSSNHPELNGLFGMEFTRLAGGNRKKVRLALAALDLEADQFKKTRGAITAIIDELR